MILLNGDQATESLAEHKDRPKPEHTTAKEKHNAKPAHAVPAKGQQIGALGESRQKSIQKADDQKGEQHQRLPRSSFSPGLRLPLVPYSKYCASPK
jgi:hypothetical protein